MDREDFILYYTHGRCIIDGISTRTYATVKDVWKKSTEQAGLLVQIKSAKAFLLELDAHVEYPVKVRTGELELEEHNSGFLLYVRGTRHTPEHIVYYCLLFSLSASIIGIQKSTH